LEKADIQEALRGFLEAEIRYQDKVAEQGVTPHWLEVGFGMPGGGDGPDVSNPEPLELRRGADRIKLRGRIDRIDRSGDGKLIAYDYKSAAYHGVREMEEGIDLQVPIYILALRQLFDAEWGAIVGGGYYELRIGSRNKGLYQEKLAHYAGLTR